MISGNSYSGLFVDPTASDNAAILAHYSSDSIADADRGALGNGVVVVPGAAGDGMTIGGSSNTIGGTIAADRNVISGNYERGVTIGGNGNVLEGNYIGTDITGSVAIGNGLVPVFTGVIVDGAQNIIGGTVAGAGNVIPGNGDVKRVRLSGSGATNNLVAGNYIGLNAAGTAAIPNCKRRRPGRHRCHGITTIGGTTNWRPTADHAGQPSRWRRAHWLRYVGQRRGRQLHRNQRRGAGRGEYFPRPLVSRSTLTRRFSNTIGGTTAAASNVISGNTNDGVEITGSGTTGNVVAGNCIGTTAAGTAALERQHNRRGNWPRVPPGATVLGGTADAEQRDIGQRTRWGRNHRLRCVRERGRRKFHRDERRWNGGHNERHRR